MATSQVFASSFDYVVAGLRLDEDVWASLGINADDGSYEYILQTVDKNADDIDWDIHGKYQQNILIAIGMTVINDYTCKYYSKLIMGLIRSFIFHFILTSKT